jgi:glyoxylase-like metal-dependent hydrolase (beta-lactamase superfamily II)
MTGLASMPRIERLDLAVVELPAGHPASSRGRSVPVYGYAIEHPDGVIVADTGVGDGNDLVDRSYRPARAGLDDALLARGLEPAAVAAVVNSHLHFDHCGQNPLLYGSGVPFFVARAEIEAVEADDRYTVRAWALPPAEQRRVVDGDAVVAAGVTVLATPGHKAGHQSVLIEGGGERIVIGAQIVWHADEYEAEVAGDANVDPDEGLRRAAVESIRRVKSLRPRSVHFSHCPRHRSPARAIGDR